jgi:hypothetical protein
MPKDEEEDTPRTKARIDALKKQKGMKVEEESSTKPFSAAVFGRPGGERLAATGPVAGLPISIQRAFRIKLLSILLMQLLISLGVGFALRLTTDVDPSAMNRTAVANNLEQHTDSTWLAKLFPPLQVHVLIFALVMIVSLPALGYIKDRHPWNLIATTIWSILWGVFMAASQLPGAPVRSQSLFVIMGSATLGVFVLLLCSQLTTRNALGDEDLWSFKASGTLAWIIMVAASFAFYSQTGHLYENTITFAAVATPLPRRSTLDRPPCRSTHAPSRSCICGRR